MYKDCDCCLFQSGRLAQLVERLPYKQNVGGSIPSAPTISFSNLKIKHANLFSVFAFLLFLFLSIYFIFLVNSLFSILNF